MRPARSIVAQIAGALAGIVALCGGACAQQAIVRSGPLSAGIDVGILIPQSMHVSLSEGITGAATLSFNPAGALWGFVGYDLTDHLGVEADLGWTLYDPSELRGSLTGPGGALSSIPLNGNFNSMLGMVNGTYWPVGRMGGFAPYLGVGIGFVLRDWGMTSRPGAAVALNVREREEDLAANLLVGLDYAVTDHFSLGARYRLLWIDSRSETLDGNAVTVSLANAYAHLLTATLRYRF